VTERLPRISLAGRPRDVAAAVDASLRRYGFFMVTDHGVPAADIDGVIAIARRFFARPIEEKLQILSQGQGSHRGYIPDGTEALALTLGAETPPDLKEGFGMGPLAVASDREAVAGLGPTYRPNRWPETPADFRPAVEAFYRRMEGLTDALMGVFAAALDLEEDFFTSRFQDHNSTFRIAHYPPLQAPPAPGQLRCGAHTDYGALTILLGENTPGGLEILTPSGGWMPVVTERHDFVINIGDLMMAWSNDRWLSNQHRVANPPPGAAATDRISLAYFCNPNDDLQIAGLPSCMDAGRPAKYAPMSAAELRHRKIEAAKASA